ncbi:SDR family NAD(P)-dependent oxidoreductase [Streptomyces griseoincarnatus]
MDSDAPWPPPWPRRRLPSRPGQSGERADSVAAGLPGATGVEWDVRDASSVARAVDRAWSRLGGIDMLVNNAGIGMPTVNPRFMTEPQGFREVPSDAFRAVIDTDLTGSFLVAGEITPWMPASGGGGIVNVSIHHSAL